MNRLALFITNIALIFLGIAQIKTHNTIRDIQEQIKCLQMAPLGCTSGFFYKENQYEEPTLNNYHSAPMLGM